MLVGVLKSNPLVVSPEALALLKALSRRDLGGAAFGLIPGRLGGGPVGARGVERGSARFAGEPNTPIAPARSYHRTMQGGGAMTLPPPQSQHGLIGDIRRPGPGGPPPSPTALQLAIQRQHAEARRASGGPRAGRFPAADLRAIGGGRMVAQPTHEGMEGIPRPMRGVQTADIPGAPEVPPWIRERAEFPEEEPEEEERPPVSEPGRTLGQAFPRGQPAPIEVEQFRALRGHAADESRRAATRAMMPVERAGTPRNPFPPPRGLRTDSTPGHTMGGGAGGVVGVIDRDRPGVTDQTRRG